MHKLRQTFSMILTLAMILTLTSLPAQGMYVVMDNGLASVTVDEGSRGLAASFDEEGRLYYVGDGVSLSRGQSLKVMQLDEDSAVPQTGAMSLTRRAGETYEDILVPRDNTLELRGDAVLMGRSRVDGTLAIPQGSSVVIEPGAELFVDDVTEGASGKIALGGTLYAYGWLNVGDWNRRVTGWDDETFGTMYMPTSLTELARLLGERFDGSDAVSRNGGWRSNAVGKKLLARLLHEDGLSLTSVDELNAAYQSDPDNWALRNAHNRVEGFDVLRGCGALELDALTEENGYDPLVTPEMLRAALQSVWASAVGGDAPEPVLYGVWEDEEYSGITLFRVDCFDEGDGHWENSFHAAVNDYLNRLSATFIASAESLTIRADGSGVYAEADDGTRCYDAVKGVTFPQELHVTVEGSAGGRRFAFEDCDFAGGADFELWKTRDADVVINGVSVGSAHVFDGERSHGVFTGMTLDEWNESVTDFAIYPGWWNEAAERPEFADEPAFTMGDDGRYILETNDYDGVNIWSKDDENWIDYPYQVKLALTLAGGVTVTYNTLWYKEGQMSLMDFARNLRGRLGDERSAVSGEDRDRVAANWSEGDYREDMDAFAFAVKHGGLEPPQDGEDWGAENYWVSHCWNEWDDLRYGTAKAILESVYRAAWSDAEHTTLPKSVKLINGEGVEWHRDSDVFQCREIEQMLDALMDVLPRVAAPYTTVTVKRDGDYEYVLFDGAADTEENRVGAHQVAGLRFTNPVTLVIDDSARREWVRFQNCAFDGGLSVTAPPLTETENGFEQGFSIDFCDSCTGTVHVAEHPQDTAAREALFDVERGDINGALADKLEWLFYRDAIHLGNADGLTVDTGNARVSIHTERGSLTVNGVTFTSEESIHIGRNYEDAWMREEEADEVLTGAEPRMSCFGNGYWWNDEADEDERRNNLDEAIVLSGTLQDVVYLGGVVDLTALTVEKNGELRLDNGPRSHITLAGQELVIKRYVGGEHFISGSGVLRAEGTMANLNVNGKWIAVGVDNENDNGFNLRIARNRLESGDYATFYGEDWQPLEVGEPHGDDGYTALWFDWGALWDAQQDYFRLEELKLKVRAGDIEVFCSDIPRDWDRMVGLREFARDLYELASQSGALTGFGVDAERLAAYWPDDWGYRWTGEDAWGSEEDRLGLTLALTCGALTDPDTDELHDPNDSPRYDTALALVKETLNWIDGSADVSDVGLEDWQDDWRLNQGAKDRLIEQFLNRLPRLPVEGEVVITLNRREDGFTYYTLNGEPVESNELFAKRFTDPVTLRYGENANEGDDWGGDLRFRNCAFEDGLLIEASDKRDYEVSFENSCTGAVMAHTDDLRELNLIGLEGLTVTADNGVTLDATEAENGAELHISRYSVHAYGNGRSLNYAAACDWGVYVVQLRLSSDFIAAENVGLTFSGEPLPFTPDAQWEGDEYVLALRRKSGEPWFDESSYDELSLTMPLSGATLTLAPPPPEWLRPVRQRELVDMLVDMLGYWDFHELDNDLRNRYANDGNRDEYVTYAAAKDILTDVWQELTEDDGATPPDFRLDDKTENEVLRRGEASELIYGQLQGATFMGAYFGDSVEELQALLESGRREVNLMNDLTLDGDVTVPEGVEFLVREGVTLTIPDSRMLTVNGELINIGVITGGGTVETGARGRYVNDVTNDLAEGLLDVAHFVNNGSVLYLVAEKENGSWSRQDAFETIEGKIDYRALVLTQEGFDNALEESYNMISLCSDTHFTSDGDVALDRLTVSNGATLTVASGTLTVETLQVRDELVVGEDAALVVRGESGNYGSITVDGTLTVKSGGALENGVWFDENGIHFSRFVVAGTVVVEEGAELRNQVDMFFEGDGVVENSGTVQLIEAQDYNESTDTFTAPDFTVPSQIEGEGRVVFYALLADSEGFAAAAALNQAAALPRVAACELAGDAVYAPEERQSFSFEELRLQDVTLTLGNVELRIDSRVEGEGSIALTDGATLTCPTDNRFGGVTGGGDWLDNGDGTSTITAAE